MKMKKMVPPAQWGDREECEKEEQDLFHGPMALGGAPEEEKLKQHLFMLHQDKLQIARPAQLAEPMESSSTSSVRCIGGKIVRPSQREEASFDLV